MEDTKCVRFLQWALPNLNMRWRGFRKVRGQVCKRIDRRIKELSLPDIESYRTYFVHNPQEWHILDHFCRITISRFYRDPLVFDYLGTDVFPVLLHSMVEQKERVMRIWSAGCASGEEPYTIALLWHFLVHPIYPDLHVEIVATDIDPMVIKRAEKGCYQESSLRNVPAEWLAHAFDRQKNLHVLKQPFRRNVQFLELDIRKEAPEGPFHIIFCRNLAFTYFDFELQRLVLEKFHEKLKKGGVLVTGPHEKIPDDERKFTVWVEQMPIFQKL